MLLSYRELANKLTEIATISLRQAAAEEILRDEALFFDLSSVLSHFRDLNRLISQLIRVEKNPGQRIKAYQQYIVNIVSFFIDIIVRFLTSPIYI